MQILSAKRSVRSFAEAFLARSLPLHCLINNAGLGLPHEAHTEDGFETTIGGLGWADGWTGMGWAGLAGMPDRLRQRQAGAGDAEVMQKS